MTQANSETSFPKVKEPVSRPPRNETRKNRNSGEKNESLLANLLLNIIIPTLILMKLSESAYVLSLLSQLDQLLSTGLAPSYDAHGTKWAIVVALAFPVIYGLRDFIRVHKLNFFSTLGVISILLTGGISLLELDPKYIAIKEAAIPGIFGLATLLSLKTRYPLVRTFLYNDKILQVDKITAALKSRDNEAAFEKSLETASYLIAMSFFLSSVLNYVLAKVLLISDPGTAAFNEELGKMTALSFPVIAVPATLVMMGALFYLFRSIQKLTHLTLEEIIHEH